MFDLLIKNGAIIDGTGKDAFCADIAIKDGKIVRIETDIEESAEKIIDAKNLTVTPGFIDSHSHSDNAILDYPDMVEKLEQGITTAVAGQCGDSIVPGRYSGENDKYIEGLGRLSEITKNFKNFCKATEKIPLGANTLTFVGHSDVRISVIGYKNRKATPDEISKMKEIVREAMENGAIGLSFGLIYTPSCYADTEELLELAKVVKEYDGLLAAHIRSESDNLIEAVEEFLCVVKETGLRAVFSHHKSAWKKNWGKVKKSLSILQQAIDEGYDIYCDVYPYTASNTSLKTVIIPREMRDKDSSGLLEVIDIPENRKKIRESVIKSYGENLDMLYISFAKEKPEYAGKFINEIAKEKGMDDIETALKILKDTNCGASVCCFSMCEEDVETVLKFNRAMICTDSSVAKGKTVYHPRLRATFPRVLGRYVREKKLVPLPEMIRRMTSLPAYVYKLNTKGLIREGYDADICIFDAEKIIDNATFTNCTKGADGLNYVIVGGKIAAKDAVYNKTKNAKFIKMR